MCSRTGPLGGRTLETIGLVFLYGITSFDDIRTRQVQLLEIIVFAVIGIIFNLYDRTNSLASIIGGVLIGVAVLLFSILTNEKIGKGDAYIIMVTGLYLGFMNTLVLLWISSIFAAVIGMIVLRKYDNSMQKELPFVPFLLLGYISICVLRLMGGV